MNEYKFSVSNFKKYYEKFSYIFIRCSVLLFVISIFLVYMYLKTNNEQFLSAFLIISCISLISIVFSLAHIDSVKRKNKNLTLKIDINLNIINNYKILKLEKYILDSSNIRLYGYFENLSSDNSINLKKYLLNLCIPRQFENENNIMENLNIIKNKTANYDEQKSNFVIGNVNLTIPIFLLVIFILFGFIFLFKSNISLFILMFILIIILVVIISYLTNEHSNDVIVFKDNFIEYENMYSRNENDTTGTIKNYCRKYTINNIQKVNINRLFITIYGNIDYSLYQISFNNSNSINSLKQLESYKKNKLIIINTFRTKYLLKSINKDINSVVS